MRSIQLENKPFGLRCAAFGLAFATILMTGCAVDPADDPEVSAQDEERVEEAELAISAPDVEWRGEGPACTRDVPCTITGSSYVGLKNTFVEQYLVYSDRRYGINLGWRSGSNLGNVRFVPQAGETVRYGEPVALFITNPSAEKYIKYREREYGINLVWSADAVYQWRITGGTPGTPVDLNEPFGLSNDAQTHVVYCPREYGINLRWNFDCPYR